MTSRERLELAALAVGFQVSPRKNLYGDGLWGVSPQIAPKLSISGDQSMTKPTPTCSAWLWRWMLFGGLLQGR